MRDWLTLALLTGLWVALSAILGRFIFTRFPGVIAVSPRSTALVIVAIPLFLGLLDVMLYYFGGNESTISYVMLTTAGSRPLVALATAYSFAVLLGHLYFPAFARESPAVHEVIARMMVALSPTFYALIIIGAGNGTLAAHARVLESGGGWAFGGYMLAVSVAGGLVGRFVLPQHVAPLPL